MDGTPTPRTGTTPTARLASILLGEPIETWLTARRAEGMPWRRIARELYTKTKGEIDVTPETLRGWHTVPAGTS